MALSFFLHPALVMPQVCRTQGDKGPCMQNETPHADLSKSVIFPFKRSSLEATNLEVPLAFCLKNPLELQFLTHSPGDSLWHV